MKPPPPLSRSGSLTYISVPTNMYNKEYFSSQMYNKIMTEI